MKSVIMLCLLFAAACSSTQQFIPHGRDVSVSVEISEQPRITFKLEGERAYHHKNREIR
jgi:hypothetical protein